MSRAIDYACDHSPCWHHLRRCWPLAVIIVASTACWVLWTCLPRWAPLTVARFSPWDDPYCRAVLASGPSHGHFSDAQVRAAMVGIRYDRVRDRARKSIDGLPAFLVLDRRCGFDAASAEDYSSDLEEIFPRYNETDLLPIMERLTKADRERLYDNLWYLFGPEDGFELPEPFRTRYPAISRSMVERRMQELHRD